MLQRLPLSSLLEKNHSSADSVTVKPMAKRPKESEVYHLRLVKSIVLLPRTTSWPARIFDESLTAFADVGVLGPHTLRRTVQVRLASSPCGIMLVAGSA